MKQVGMDKVMSEAADPPVFEWYVETTVSTLTCSSTTVRSSACGDEGRPIVVEKPKSVAAQAYAAIAATLAEQLHAAPATLLLPNHGFNLT
jgi:hypothetical protein